MQMARRDDVINDCETRLRSARRQNQLVPPLRLTPHHRAIFIPAIELGFEIVGLTEIVDRRDVEQQIKVELRVIMQNTCGRGDALARDVDAIIATIAPVFEHECAQPVLHRAHQRREFLIVRIGRLADGILVVISGHIAGAGSRFGS